MLRAADHACEGARSVRRSLVVPGDPRRSELGEVRTRTPGASIGVKCGRRRSTRTGHPGRPNRRANSGLMSRSRSPQTIRVGRSARSSTSIARIVSLGMMPSRCYCHDSPWPDPDREAGSSAAAAPAATATAALRHGRYRGPAHGGAPGRAGQRDGGQQLHRVGMSGRAVGRVAGGAHRPVDLEGIGALSAAELVSRHPRMLPPAETVPGRLSATLPQAPPSGTGARPAPSRRRCPRSASAGAPGDVEVAGNGHVTSVSEAGPNRAPGSQNSSRVRPPVRPPTLSLMYG